MSLKLTIGNRAVISPVGPGGANLSPLRSLWIGYTFTINPDIGHVNIGSGYLALYLSHDSRLNIPALTPIGPQLVNYGQVLDDVEIGDASGNKIKLRNLDYIAVEDIECANQAMQLHVLRFNSQRGNVREWVDDQGWQGPALPASLLTSNNKPFWKRQVNYRNCSRYAHFIGRHRNAAGLLAVAASLPFGSRSLFQYLLERHHQPMPDVEFRASDSDNSDHWGETVGVANVLGMDRPRGLAMVTMGVFGSLRLTNIMQDRWISLMDGNSDFELCRVLAGIAGQGYGRPHTLNQFALHSEDCISGQMNASPQDVFFLRLTA